MFQGKGPAPPPPPKTKNKQTNPFYLVALKKDDHSAISIHSNTKRKPAKDQMDYRIIVSMGKSPS